MSRLTPRLRRHRWRRSSGRLVVAAGAVLALASAAALSGSAGPAAAAPTDDTAAASHPDWQQYLQTPSSTDVQPVSIVSVSGDVTNADALTHPGDGQTATLTATPTTVTPHPVTVTFPSVSARYVRLDVTKLGLTVSGDGSGSYVQLAELQVFGSDPNDDLAQDAPATASETKEVSGWSVTHLTDGVTDSETATDHGWTSQPHGSTTDVSGSPIWATIDLGSVQSVSSVVLWPRTDTLSPDGHTASFPVDYDIATSASGTATGDFTVQKSITAQEDPAPPTVTGPASIVLDYGHEVGGYPTFDVSAASGSPTMRASYSEARTQIGPTGDGAAPSFTADLARYDDYTVSGPGRITNQQIQGGERYEQITLTTPGTVSLTGAGIEFSPYRAQPEDYQGHFLSSSDQLNQIWYDGAYTVQMDQVPTNSVGIRWGVSNGALDAVGTKGGVGLLTAGKSWTDYTVTFEANLTQNQVGWMVRSSDPNNGFILILDGPDDKNGTPNKLQEVSEVNGSYHTIATVSLSTPIQPGDWHSIKEVVAGTTVTTFIDGTQVATFDSAGASYGEHPVGSFGFREFGNEEASFRNLAVTNPDGDDLYRDDLSTSAATADFDQPATNALPVILDGAKRDREVWSGDLAVEEPTLAYSTGSEDYIRGSIQLLGSYAGSNGYVSAWQAPQTPVNQAAPGSTSNGYSADYSMYFVRDLAIYYLYSADTAFVEQEWPVVERELAWSAQQVDANGLFATTSGNGKDWDYYDSPKTGEVTAYNAIYYQTLLDGATLATATGRTDLAAQYTAQATALKTAINDRLLDPSTGLYDLSDSVTGVLAQDANALAVEYGIAPADKVDGILAAIKSNLWTSHGTLPFSSGNGFQDVISPFVSGFELDARFDAGQTDDALKLMTDEWGPMTEPGDYYTGTFWENESPTGAAGTDRSSLAHGWSTMPTSALSAYVLGIRPVDPGYQTWLVQPHAGDLAWTEGQAPTPHGTIAVDWNHDSAAGSFTMHVQAPDDTTGTIAVPTFGKSVDISIDGRQVWQQGHAVGSSATLDGDYVDIPAGAGTHDVVSTIAPPTTGGDGGDHAGTPGGPVVTPVVVHHLKGKAKVGKKVTVKVSVPSGAHVSYQWFAGKKRIKHATHRKLKLTKKLRHKRIKVKVTITLPGQPPVVRTVKLHKRVS